MSKAEKTRQFIVEKAAPVFNVKGYAGTSINDLISATGLTKGSIYGNFANKDEVALAAFDYNLKSMLGALNREIEKQTSAKNKLLVYSEIYGELMSKTFPVGGCPVLNTSTEADDTHPELRKRAAQAIMSWKNSIAMTIKKGISNNEFRSDVDPDQIAITLVALIEGCIMIGKVTGSEGYRTAIMNSVKKMINDLE